MRKRILLSTKNIFTVSILVISLTILSVWFYGIGKHQTIIENSFISTSVLSVAFFLFISIGLYNGVKLQDTLGRITDRFDLKKIEHLKDFELMSGVPDIGEGLMGILAGLIAWFIASILIGYLFFLFGAVFWIAILIFMGMLYWVFFRALRLVFKKAKECQGNLQKSFFYGVGYTFLYNFWLYGILLFATMK